MIEWLLAPIDAGRGHDIPLHVAWHARLMLLAWAGLFPIGVIAARFFKITPRQDWPQQRDNRIWWATHLLAQYSGGVAVLVAVGLVWFAPNRIGASAFHTWLGWCVVGFCALQFLGGWFRGSKGGPTDPRPDGSINGDHYDMTPRRRIFERLHKSVGYVAIAIAIAAIVNGLWSVNAPRWMWMSIAIWWLELICLSFILQRRGFAVDTYQAIWGPDPKHPGNRVAPIGWGVHRRDPGKTSSTKAPS